VAAPRVRRSATIRQKELLKCFIYVLGEKLNIILFQRPTNAKPMEIHIYLSGGIVTNYPEEL
jgi:hypothetical protein